MTPDMNNDPYVLLFLGLIAWAMVLWPEARAALARRRAARRAARAARLAAPRDDAYRGRWS